MFDIYSLVASLVGGVFPHAGCQYCLEQVSQHAKDVLGCIVILRCQYHGLLFVVMFGLTIDNQGFIRAAFGAAHDEKLNDSNPMTKYGSMLIQVLCLIFC